jgi:hypothetical protein
MLHNSHIIRQEPLFLKRLHFTKINEIKINTIIGNNNKNCVNVVSFSKLNHTELPLKQYQSIGSFFKSRLIRVDIYPF